MSAMVDERGDALGREDVRIQGRLPVLPGLQGHPAQLVPQPELLQHNDRLRRQGQGPGTFMMRPRVPQPVSPTNIGEVHSSICATRSGSDRAGSIRTLVHVGGMGLGAVERGQQQQGLNIVCGSSRVIICLLHTHVVCQVLGHPPSNLPRNTRDLTALCTTCALG